MSAMWYRSDGGRKSILIWVRGGMRELSRGCFDEQDIRRVVAEAEFGHERSSSPTRCPAR